MSTKINILQYQWWTKIQGSDIDVPKSNAIVGGWDGCSLKHVVVIGCRLNVLSRTHVIPFVE
ncbi:MAG: hypothetical protein E7069_03760 [Bacteroidales bacterium]|nr:hypothetical protein [Bacteroidales bacterium]